MRSLITLIVLLATFLGGVVPARALTGLTAWSQRFGSTLDDVGYAVATDASGNVYVTGNFSGTVNFGGSNLVSAGELDIFLAKYNAAGVHQWSQRFGGTGLDGAASVAVDASGNVVITGDFNGTANFGGANLVSAANLDAFLAKYNAAGVHQWSQRLGGTGDDRGNSVAVDGAGNVFLAGWFNLTTNFGGVNLVSAGSFDVVVAEYNAAGVHQWSQRYGGAGLENGVGMALDASGNIVVAGYFSGTANLGGANLVSAGQYDIFVAKYDGVGVHQWSQGFGSTNFDAGYSVAVDASSNVLVTGYFLGTVDFGGDNLVSAGGNDIFLAKYSSLGVHQWSKRFGALSGDFGTSVAANASSDVFLTGLFAGTVDFGGGNLVGGSQDIFVAKYDAAGVHQWSRRFGGTGLDAANAIAVDVSGNAFATGYFGGTVNFGTGNLVSAGDPDIFLVKFMRETAEPMISAITDIGNDQGRQVKITFDRSAHDDPVSATPVILYEAYRRSDAPPAYVTARDLGGMSSRQLLDQGWTEVGTVHGHGKSEYSIDVPTIGDSTIAQGPYNSTFFIRGATANSFNFFDSPLDSGYSLDNLAPGVPSSLVFETGDLSWDESSAADFDFFTVYGSNTSSFGSAVVVDYSVAPAMDVSGSPYVYYFVTATDFSGNEGRPATVNTLTGVGGTPNNYVLSVGNYPNPFNPRTTVSYTVPSRGRVTVSVYDARGSRVATLIDNEERAAGAYRADWDGRDDRGVVAASGVYFAHIEHVSGTRSKKMVLLK
jgi:FlgD Ig-like domain/Beta-propeller repeat